MADDAVVSLWTANVDRRVTGDRDHSMVPRLSEFYGMVAFTYWRDHAPPHFHVEYGEAEALILVDDGAVYAGTLPRRALRLVREWRLLHKGDCFTKTNWSLPGSGSPDGRIPVRSSPCREQDPPTSQGDLC